MEKGARKWNSELILMTAKIEKEDPWYYEHEIKAKEIVISDDEDEVIVLE